VTPPPSPTGDAGRVPHRQDLRHLAGDRLVDPAATQQALRTLEWIRRAENLAVVGPSGTGKSHLLEALGHAAIDDGLTVAWFTIETLGRLVTRHRADDSVAKAVNRILTRRPRRGR
jgi:DNA replication protein DnaC